MAVGWLSIGEAFKQIPLTLCGGAPLATCFMALIQRCNCDGQHYCAKTERNHQEDGID